jgi:hypothetical protein
MSNTKHTPGPWIAETETMENARAVLDDVERMLWAGGAHNFTITTVRAPDNLPTPPPEWSNGQVVVAFLGNGPTGPTNARVIAAAPDLLAACEAFADAFINGTDEGRYGEAFVKALVAIERCRPPMKEERDR